MKYTPHPYVIRHSRHYVKFVIRLRKMGYDYMNPDLVPPEYDETSTA